MELKSKLTLATLICAGLFATGCSQQQSAGSQQTTGQRTAEPAPVRQAPVSRPAPAHRPASQYRPPAMPPIKVPHVKAKGNYKGPVQMDQSSRDTMQQYQH